FKLMTHVTDQERTARFVCVMALALPEKIQTFRAEVEGIIAHQPAGNKGFGYDPIFYLPQFGLTSAQLDMEQKNSISHRGKALQMVLESLS
ncbi:MAG: non-canonical purine NTP pyrophosphatase, partial [Defluviitaleaceae bacterium]|nr:non-canonical purine NTP pyrophosphatase [Defluviitaleaceae bacterium]